MIVHIYNFRCPFTRSNRRNVWSIENLKRYGFTWAKKWNFYNPLSALSFSNRMVNVRNKIIAPWLHSHFGYQLNVVCAQSPRILDNHLSSTNVNQLRTLSCWVKNKACAIGTISHLSWFAD